MNNLIQLNSSVVQALGWSLIHSLWQGLLIAAVLYCTLILLRNQSALWRYAVCCGALFTIVLSILTTFFVVVSWSYNLKLFAQAEHSAMQVPAQGASISTLVGEPLDFPGKSRSPVEASLPYLVMLWIAGVTFFSLRSVVAWSRLRRFRLAAEEVLDSILQQNLKDLAKRFEVSQPIRLLQSAMLEVPVVIGWITPAIILPVSILAGLTPVQLEAILLHELAHIRRRDYLINLLQVGVETLLFFHPAVWWISKCIRQEREDCCDDLVLGVQGDATNYVKALASLEEGRSDLGQLSLAARGGDLLRRVRRISTGTRESGNPVAGFAMIAGVLGLFIILQGLRTTALAAENANTKTPVSLETDEKAEAKRPTHAKTPVLGDIPDIEQQQATKSLRTLEQLLAQHTERLSKMRDHLRQIKQSLGMSDRALQETVNDSRAEVIRSLEHEKATTRIALLNLETTLDQLKTANMKTAIPALLPDPLLNSLLESETKAEQDVVRLSENLGDTHPDMKAAQRLQQKIGRQIDERIKNVMNGLQTQVEQKRIALKKLEDVLQEEKLREIMQEERVQPYFEKKRELEAIERTVETIRLRILQETVDRQMAERFQ